MKQRKLGSQGLVVSEIGLGCMGMSEFYGAIDDVESTATIHRALDLGITLLDTADMYGPYTNEVLLGQALKGKRDQVLLATKFGIIRDPANPSIRGVNGKRDYVRFSCEGSLRRLNTDVIDLYYQHRVDPATPIEETVGAMAELVREGKIRYIGLSEAGPATIRRAHAVHPITALQTEYSLFAREPEDGILSVCRELGIGFIAYSPLGRGFLTGRFQKFEDLPADDYRRKSPRFMGENFQKNLHLLRRIEQIAAEKNCTPSQLALAWVVAQSGAFSSLAPSEGERAGVRGLTPQPIPWGEIIAIPGTRQRKYLEENVAALKIELTAADLARINDAAPRGGVAGTRYPEAMMAAMGR